MGMLRPSPIRVRSRFHYRHSTVGARHVVPLPNAIAALSYDLTPKRWQARNEGC